MAARNTTSGGSSSRTTYTPSADRAEYAAQSEEERRRTRERQQRPDGSYYGGTAPAGPTVEIVNRDITQWREQIEAQQAQREVEETTNPLGLGQPGDDSIVPGSGSVDLFANWSDRRWALYDEARADAEGTDVGEFFAWAGRDRDPEARGDEDQARFDAMNRALSRETIEDWKARMKRAGEYGEATVFGEVISGVGPRGRFSAPDPTDPEAPPPVAEEPETRYAQVVDPVTGAVRNIRIDGVYKNEQTPTAGDLAKSLMANGQDDMVFVSWSGDYGAGQSRLRPVLASRDSMKYFDNMTPEEQDQVIALTQAYYEGMPYQFSWIEKRWEKALDIAHNALYEKGVYKSPFQAYEDMLVRWKATEGEKNRTGGGGGYYGGGGYGGGSATTQRITLTSPTDAMYLLNQAMSQYLGRQATSSELSRFVKLLNNLERQNPVVATMSGDTTVQSGGFNPATFAEQFARSREGSAEFMAATTFLDAMLSAMNSEVGVI